MYDIDDKDYELINDLEKDVKPGEILYCDFKIQYRLKNKIHYKEIRQGILSRPYESHWPKIETNHIGISRWFDNKHKKDISDVIIKSIKIIARTGFINKKSNYVPPTNEKPRRIIEDWEKTERLDNGTFV